MRPRKLFPSQTLNTTSLNCSGFCDPACPLNCYPALPDDLLPPPPSQSDQRISPLVIIIVSLLAAVFLLASYYVIFGKSFLDRCRSLLHGENQQAAELDPNADRNDDVEQQQRDLLVGRNQVHHPIWYIATVGLPQSIIDSIAVCNYKKGERLIDGTECSVCLSEFQDGETLRLLPYCSHAFHVSCIDTWLRSHTNCPLCRAHIVAEPLPGSGPNNNNNNTRDGSVSVPPTTATAQNPESDADAAEDSVGEGTGNDVGETDDNNTRIEGCFGDSRKSLVKKKLRKSSSMDFLPASAAEIVALCDEPTEAVDSGTSSESGSFKKPSRSSSIVQHLGKSPVSMKRSNSCGGRGFRSRINRSQSLILPL